MYQGVIVGPLASLFAERFSCRSALVVGAVVTCVGFALSGMATQLYHVYLSYGIMGG